jgi:hypothetical protein
MQQVDRGKLFCGELSADRIVCYGRSGHVMSGNKFVNL